MKKKLKYCKEEYANLKTTKNYLLSWSKMGQKAEKLRIEKKNALKNARYWCNKFLSDCIEVDEKDDEDFKTM